MSSKLRVYEVARDLGMDNKELVTLLQSIGFSEIKNHMSVVPSEAIDRAKRRIERKNEPNKVVEERIRPTVVKRRTAAKRPEDGAGAESGSTHVAAAVHAPTPVHPASEPRILAAPIAPEAKPAAGPETREPEAVASKAEPPAVATAEGPAAGAEKASAVASVETPAAKPNDKHTPTPESHAEAKCHPHR
ncbi:MAG: translation initiation factor IF-2 N-terminal domain-containing protein [Polyangiaceae bacterium]